MRKTCGSIAVSAIAVTALASCGLIDGVGTNYDKQETKTFRTGKEGKEQKVLPTWVADDATDITEVIRTTGEERILRMTSALPGSCTPLPSGQKPAPVGNPDNSNTAADYSEGPATLTANWWPKGIEQRATALCGRWWLTLQGEYLYAYAPELKRILESIKTQK